MIFYIARRLLWTVVVVADRRRTAMILKLEALRVERADLQRFAARVLDAL